MSGAYDFTAEQGATFSRLLTWTVDGVNVDLSGWAARMQVRKSYGSSVAIIDLDQSDGITLDNDGGILIRIEALEMTVVPAGEYVYDLEVMNGTEVIRLIGGKFVVTPEVTR